MISSEDKAGLYITAIVHLVVIIVLLLTQVSAAIKGQESFVIDFSKEEAQDRKKAEERRQLEQETFEEAISRRLDDLIAGNTGMDFRNTAVDRGSEALKDDRGTDADELYKDAEELAKDLKNGVELEEEDDSFASVESQKPKQEKKETKAYSGPSVVSYDLDGRKASRLPIPAYRCYGGGMVTVIITVNKQGQVIDAKVQEETSSTDRCLREYAVRAAKMSRFSIDRNAPVKHYGDIVYQFIAQ